MTSRALGRLASLVLLGVSGAHATQAHAFCRATTVESREDSCRVCETAGYPLAWEQPSIAYTFNERGFPGFTDQQLRTIFREAIDEWQSVSCDGRQVEIDVYMASGSTALGPRDPQIEPNVNVIGYLTADEWADEENDPHAFAQTGVRYFKQTGVIAGADIWFNGGIGEFGVCPRGGCDDVYATVDLPNVVTHEVGHFYGLAHSSVDGATMGCDALPGQTDKRDLAADDRQGMCAMYPPGLAFDGPYAAGTWKRANKIDAACSVSAPGMQRRESWLALLGLGLLVAVRSRRHRSSRAR